LIRFGVPGGVTRFLELSATVSSFTKSTDKLQPASIAQATGLQQYAPTWGMPLERQQGESCMKKLWGMMRSNMRNLGLGSFAGALLWTMLIPNAAQAQYCNSDTIYGAYMFRISGQIFGPNGSVTARDGVALTRFDGVGGLTQEDFVMSEGVAVPGPTDPVNGFHNHEWGTYIVNGDCTGSAVINFPPPPGLTSGAVIKLMFVVSKRGQTIHTIVSSVTPPGSSTPVPANIHSDAERIESED
jgi:hypothetical protein